MTRDLTEAQYFSLPLVSSKDRVVGMKAIFVHANLKNSPVSILTATGQYKLSPKTVSYTHLTLPTKRIV